jgi:hypothetical protein
VRLVVSSTSLRPRSYQTVIGNIKTISRNQITVTFQKDQTTHTFVLNKNTAFQDNEGNTVDIKAFSTDQQVLVIAYEDKNDVIIHTLRSLAPKKVSTSKK